MVDFKTEQKKYLDAVNAFNNKLYGDSYSGTFFNDALRNSYEQYLKNRDNPEKLTVETDAYVDGISKNIPEEEKQGVMKPILEMNKSLKEDSLKNFNDAALEQADNSITMNRIEAGNLAVAGFVNNLPTDAQLVLDANYFDKIGNEVRIGHITDEQGIKLKDYHIERRFIYALQNVLRDKGVPEEDKADLVDKIATGKTGNKFIDSLDAPLRLEMLKNAVSTNRQLDEYQEHLSKKDAVAKKDYFDSQYLNTLRYASAGGDPRVLDDMITRLRAIAPSDEDFNRIGNIYKAMERQTSPEIKLELDNMISSGKVSQEEMLRQVNNSERFLSVKDYGELVDRIKNPVAETLKSQEYQVAMAAAKAKYGWSPERINGSYDWFMYKLYDGLAKADTPEKRAKVIDDAFKSTDAMFSDRTQTSANVGAIEVFAKKAGMTPESIAIDVDNEARTLARQALKGKQIIKKDETVPYLDRAKSNVIKRMMKNKNMLYQDAVMIVDEALQIQGMEK